MLRLISNYEWEAIKCLPFSYIFTLIHKATEREYDDREYQAWLFRSVLLGLSGQRAGEYIPFNKRKKSNDITDADIDGIKQHFNL